jgi:hypothetical protein
VAAAIEPQRGRKVGKAITSRIDGLSVSSMTRRSMPMPCPPQGGSPFKTPPLVGSATRETRDD